jgi:DHA1 family bicyclomycin/chloramphenicol resistance-like MFS transporter/DHA1 family 2-module integral membrane pump EmrD-like MFS transporter
MGPVTLIYFGSSFIWPNAFSAAFTPFGEIAGYAGALYGSFQVGGAAALGGLSSCLPHTHPLVFSSIVFLSSVVAWSIYEKVVDRLLDEK